MPPLPRQPVPTLARLEDELRFAPRDVILRVIDRLESLAPDISPDGHYPEDWIVHRLTGYRPDKASDQLTPGPALLAGLSPMSERLCQQVALTQPDFPDAFSAADLLARWSISSKTLARVRQQGLVARRVVGEDGRAKLAFRPAAVTAFESSHQQSLAKAARFSKLSPRDQRWALRAAPRYRAWAGLSSQATAAHIAAKLGRATETIRALLARHGQGHTRAARNVSPRALWRAWRWGATPKDLARAVRRSPSVVRRDISLVRLQHLLQVLPALETPTGRHSFGMMDHPSLVTGLGLPAPTTVEDLLKLARNSQPPVAVEERARLAGFHSYRLRAANGIRAVDASQPQPRALDRVETDLLWAARLGVALVQAQLRTIVLTLEGRLEAPLELLPGPQAADILLEALRAAALSLHAIDPAKGARVAGAVSLATDKVAARRVRPATGSRSATPIVRTPMPDWSLNLFPWQPRLEVDPRLLLVLPGAQHLDREPLLARFGYFGRLPHTFAELAKMLDISEQAAAVLVREITLAALSPTRGPAFPPRSPARTLIP